MRDVERDAPTVPLLLVVLDTVELEPTAFVPLMPMQSVRESFISAANVSYVPLAVRHATHYLVRRMREDWYSRPKLVQSTTETLLCP